MNHGNRKEFRRSLLWRRELFESEEELKQQLTNLVTIVQWKKEESDGWIWDGKDSSTYSVQLGYKTLKEEHQSPQCEWFKALWTLKVSGPAKLCVWRTMIDIGHQLE